MSALTLRERETLKIRILDIIESVNNHKELPQPEKQSTPKAASTDRREERKPATNADKSAADRLLDEWEQKHPYEMRHREQVIDMAIYAGLFISVPGREAKWKAIEPALIRWEDEGKITIWLGGMY